MLTDRRKLTACLSAVLLNGLAYGPAAAQHVHGTIELGIVMEDNALAVTLQAPLADVVGFEHEPESDAQAERLKSAAASLAQAEAMFGPSESAACAPHDVTIDGPAYLRALLETEQHDEHAEADTSHEAHADHEDHADHEAHADDADHTDHGDHDDHDNHETHADVRAAYVWECARPSELQAIEARFVGKFHNVEKVNIQILTPTGTRYFETDEPLDSIRIAAP